jgi:hypothetical protein
MGDLCAMCDVGCSTNMGFMNNKMRDEGRASGDRNACGVGGWSL